MVLSSPSSRDLLRGIQPHRDRRRRTESPRAICCLTNDLAEKLIGRDGSYFDTIGFTKNRRFQSFKPTPQLDEIPRDLLLVIAQFWAQSSVLTNLAWLRWRGATLSVILCGGCRRHRDVRGTRFKFCLRSLLLYGCKVLVPEPIGDGGCTRYKRESLTAARVDAFLPCSEPVATS